MRTSVRIALAGSAIVAGVAFASPALAATNDYPQKPANGTSTTAVTAGQSATFTAGGFQSGSTVHVTVSDGRSFSVKASSAGEVALSISFANAGTYTVTATGVDANGAARVVSSTVKVNAGSVAAISSTTSSSNTGGLPFTGLEVGSVIALGAATVVGGTAVRVVARRKAAHTA